jgi:hypothetical protein
MRQWLSQGCRLSQDESSLSFTMLLRLESLFPFSVSPPLAVGNIAVLGDILLDFASCGMPASRFLGFWVLETWQSSLTLVGFWTS